MNKILTIGIVGILLASPVWAQERHSEIQSWKEIKAEKGYILSNDLYYKKMCSKIWSQQVQEFSKKNPKVKDPNVISINQIINVQDCRVEASQPEVKPEIVFLPAPVKQVQEQKEKLLAMNVGLEYNRAEEKGGKPATEGFGLKLEVSKHIQLSKGLGKLSAGVLLNQTKSRDSGISQESKQLAVTADGAYLFEINDKLQIGPNLGIILGRPANLGIGVEDQNSLISGFLGADLEYKLNERVFLDAKVGGGLENRINLLTTFGLGFKF